MSRTTQFSSHAYIWYANGQQWAPRFCYVDNDTCPVPLLGAVWRYHPALCNFVEQDGDVYVSSVTVRVNGEWTQQVRIPTGILIDALQTAIYHGEKGEELLKDLETHLR